MTRILTRATLDDLRRTDGKAELIGGRIVQLMASGFDPSRIAFRIAMDLEAYSKRTEVGRAFPDGIGYSVPELSSGRESFSPDASYYVGPLPANRMRFIDGPPTFAVEVRSEFDYGTTAETELAMKRADYFEAGTLIVWDVDPDAKVIHSYRADSPDQPINFAIGQTADAEPAVPGWRIEVDTVYTS